MPTRLTEKTCKDCGETKPLSGFYIDARGYTNGASCRECRKLRATAWRAAHPERTREVRKKAMRKFYAARPDYQRHYWLKKHYGLTPAEYDEMVQSQGGLCAICSNPPADAGTPHFAVDHDHDTGKVRGLLCRRCNTMLGFIESLGLLGRVDGLVDAYLKQELRVT